MRNNRLRDSPICDSPGSPSEQRLAPTTA
jgi:hypothetical protein